eukprot:scaffold12776_cov63-Phaeocystis_antarctica.AAC.3
MGGLLAGLAAACCGFVLLAAGTQTDWEIKIGATGGRLHWSFEQCQCQATTGRRPTQHAARHHMGVHHWACITCKRAQSQACRAIAKNRHQHWHQHHLAWVGIAAMGLFLLTIVAIVQSRGPPEEQAVHRQNGRSPGRGTGPGTPVRRSSSRRLYDSPSAALLPESYMSPEAVDLQDRQPSVELAGHLAKARRSSEAAKEADLDDLDFITRARGTISKAIFGSPELRV